MWRSNSAFVVACLCCCCCLCCCGVNPASAASPHYVIHLCARLRRSGPHRAHLFGVRCAHAKWEIRCAASGKMNFATSLYFHYSLSLSLSARHRPLPTLWASCTHFGWSWSPFQIDCCYSLIFCYYRFTTRKCVCVCVCVKPQ